MRREEPTTYIQATPLNEQDEQELLQEIRKQVSVKSLSQNKGWLQRRHGANKKSIYQVVILILQHKNRNPVSL